MSKNIKSGVQFLAFLQKSLPKSTHTSVYDKVDPTKFKNINQYTLDNFTLITESLKIQLEFLETYKVAIRRNENDMNAKIAKQIGLLMPERKLF